MKPILRSALPWRAPDDEVKDLKRWVRFVATAYILLLIPVLGFVIVMMVMHAPRFFATAWDSLGVRWDKTSAAFDEGNVPLGIGNALQLAALVLPALGMVVTTARIGSRLGKGASKWSAGSPARKVMVGTATAASVAFAAVTLWPNGEYRPIQPGERGTLGGAVKSFSAVSGGRPALTPEREAELKGAPSQRDTSSVRDRKLEEQRARDRVNGPSGTTTTEAPAEPTPAEPAPGTTTQAAPAEPAPSDTTTSTAPAPSDTTTTTTPTTP
jgi:putative peptide zinc metalloprotease protein